MRRIRAATILSSFCAAVDGGRAAAAFSTANPKSKPHTKPPSDIFGVFSRNQLQNDGRARKILFREYGGRATKDEDDELADEEKVNIRKVPFSQEELIALLKNLWIECETDYKKYRIVREEFRKVFKKTIQDDTNDGLDDESGDATQNDRVNKLAEVAADEELDAFVTNSFATKLMIECEPKYEKRFREVIEKVRKKIIRDDQKLKEFKLVTDFMSKFEPEYEKLLCEVLEKVCYKISQDDKGENDNTSKIEKLAKLGNKWKLCSFEEEMDVFVTRKFLKNLRSVEEKKSYFMAYEVIEKVAKKVGTENLRKIAEENLDALVTDCFVHGILGVQTHIPYLKLLRLRKSGSRRARRVNIRKVSFSQEEFNAFLKNLWIECLTDYGIDYEKIEIVRREFHTVLKKDDEIDDESSDATQNDRVDKLAEIAAEEELDALITNSFVTNLMIECEPKYEKRFREIIEKVRKKMIQDDGILGTFELVTNLMSKCEPEYEKLLCEVLEKVREKIAHQDDKGENKNIHKIEKLAKLDMKVWDLYNFKEELDKFVTRNFLENLRSVEEKKSYFMAYEVIEKVAKKVGNENLRKIAEENLDALVTDCFVSEILGVQTSMPHFKLLRLVKSEQDADDALDGGEAVGRQVEGRKSEEGRRGPR